MTITDHTGPLPSITTPPGIVALSRDRMTAAVQCSVCHRAKTERGMWALGMLVVRDGWNFAADPGNAGHLPYRRCPDCRAARLHPKEAA